MKWYRGLYMGDNAKKAKYKVFGRIRKGRFQPDTFLIMLPTNTNNILDIVSSNYMLQPHFKKNVYKDELYVIGIAQGKDEALELVRGIVDEVYKNTGGFDVGEYLKFGRNRKR